MFNSLISVAGTHWKLISSTLRVCPGVAKLLDIFILSITFHKCLDEITAISRCKYLKVFSIIKSLFNFRFEICLGFWNYVYTFAPCSLFIVFLFLEGGNIFNPPTLFYWSQFICPHTCEVFNFITTPVCMPSCSISIHHVAWMIRKRTSPSGNSNRKYKQNNTIHHCLRSVSLSPTHGVTQVTSCVTI